MWLKRANWRFDKARRELQASDRLERVEREQIATRDHAAASVRHHWRVDFIRNRADALIQAEADKCEWTTTEAAFLLEVKLAETRKHFEKTRGQVQGAVELCRALRGRVEALAGPLQRLGLPAPDLRARKPRKAATLRDMRQRMAHAELDLVRLEARHVGRSLLGLGSGWNGPASEIEPVYHRVCHELARAAGPRPPPATNRAKGPDGAAQGVSLALRNGDRPE